MLIIRKIQKNKLMKEDSTPWPVLVCERSPVQRAQKQARYSPVSGNYSITTTWKNKGNP